MTTYDVPRVGRVMVLIDERDLPAAGLKLLHLSRSWRADGTEIDGEAVQLETAYLRARGVTNC